MKFEDSIHAKNLNHTKVQLAFGDFYLCENIVVAELNRETHVDWLLLQKIAHLIETHYGKSGKISYISNKVNSYSIDPTVWIKFYDEFDFIVAAAIVWYSNMDYMNATLEKGFSKKKVKRCDSLEIAVEWLTAFKDLN